MGRAKVVQVVSGAGTIVVNIERDTDLLEASEINLFASEASLQSRIATQEFIVANQQVQVDAAKTQLNNAIANQDPIEDIKEFQNDFYLQTEILILDKTDLSASRFQLIGVQKQLAIVQNELTRTIGINNVTITTADSGLSFSVNQIIGVAEVARQSDVGSTFIALPSERIGFDPTYNIARDGITLPALSEQPRGWFYNSLIIASAQIFRPRYYLAQILTKSDPDNEAVIVYFSSGDFRGKPFNRAFDTSVPFDYETTNSLSFIVGGLVLVEFSSSGTPTIIGFGNPPGGPRFDGQPIAFYKNLTSSTGLVYSWRLEILSDLTGQGITEAFPSWAATDRGARITSGTLHSQGLSHFVKFSDPKFGGILETVDQSSITRNNVVLFDARAVDSALLNFNPPIDFQFYNVKAGGSLIAIGAAAKEFFYKRQGDAAEVPPPHAGVYTANATSLGVASAPFNSTSTLFNRRVQVTGVWPNGAGQQFYETGNLDISQPDDTTIINEFTKLAALSVGQFMETDYLFDDSNYVTPPEDNQFLVISKYLSYINDNQNLPNVFDLFIIRPAIAFGLPPAFTSVTPIGDSGASNLIDNSEVVISANGDVEGTSAIITDLVSPSNTEPVYGIARSPTDPQFRPFHSALSASTTHTFSCFVRRNSYCFATLKNIDLTSTEIEFDLIEGTVLTTIPATNIIDADIVEHDEEWWRIFIVSDTSASPSSPAFSVTGAGKVSDNNGFNSLAVWGFQLTEDSDLVEYLKTP